MTKTRFLVLGSSGLIGSRFIDLVSEEKHVVPTEEELDITDEKAISAYFEKHKNDFDVVVNFAAYTDVKASENERGDESGAVWTINVIGSENVAKICQKHGKFLIHISTDFVFPGTKEFPGPYKENAKPPEKLNNLGWYAWTKLMAEKRVSNVYKNVAIVRLGYPFRAASYKLKQDFANIILSLFDDGKLFPLFKDQIITPIFIDDAVVGIEKIAELKRPGIYHVATSDSVPYFEFGEYLIEKARGKKGVVESGSKEEFLKSPGRVPSPIWGGLDTTETQKVLGMKFRTWKEAVDEFVKQLS